MLWIPSTRSVDYVLSKNFDGTFFGDNNPKCGAVNDVNHTQFTRILQNRFYSGLLYFSVRGIPIWCLSSVEEDIDAATVHEMNEGKLLKNSCYTFKFYLIEVVLQNSDFRQLTGFGMEWNFRFEL